METTTNTFDRIPQWVLEKWQEIVDLLAETIGVPAALIRKIDNEFIEVFISGHSENNPYVVGSKEERNGMYCESVIKTQNKLLVPNASIDKVWERNPDVKLGMVSYLGYPIKYLDNQVYGTLCILDNKERQFTLQNEKLILQFRNVIELDLALIQSNELKSSRLSTDFLHKIADRKKVEEVLHEEELKYHTLFETADDAIMLFTDNAWVDCNAGALKVFGCTREQIIGKHPGTFSPSVQPDGLLSEQEAIRRINLAYAGESQFFEWEHIHMDGKSFAAEVKLNRLDLGGKPFLLAIVRDVSQRKQSEQLINLVKSSLEAASDALFWVTADGAIVNVNKAACNLLGYTREELLKLSVPNIDVHFNTEIWEQHFYELRNLGTLKFESEQKTKDGQLIPVEIVANYIRFGVEEYNCAFVRDITDRKQAEEKLRLKNFVFDISIAAKIITNLNGFITEINGSFLRVWGYPGKNEVIGKPISFFIKDPDEVMTMLTALKDTGEWEGEYLARKKDGSTFIAHGLATVVKDEAGKILAYQSSVIDITERKQVEEALQDSEKRFRNVLQDIKSVAVQGYAPDGTTTYWNKASELLYGFTAQEAIGSNLLDLIIPSEMKDNVRDAIKWMAVTGQPIPSSELVLKRKDGSRVTVFSHHTIVQVSGRSQELFCIDIDLTDRKLAEDKLKVSEQLYRNLFDQANEGLILLTMDGKIAELNQSFAKMHGYTVDEMKNMDIKDLDVLRENAFDGRAEVMKRIYNGEVVRFEVEHYHKNGHSFFLSDTVSIITIAGEKYFLAFHQDITERKKAEDELIKAKEKAEESDKLKTAFLTNMSHEIRTPMNGVIGFLDLVSETGLTGEEKDEYIALIQQSGKRMLNILHEIVDISRIESGQTVIHFQKTNINEKIENVYKLLKPDAENKRVNLSFKNSLPSEEAITLTDEDKLYAILTNLVRNAIKYTDKGSIEFGYDLVETRHAETRDVETRHALSLLQFYVKDTGIGIPKDRQEAIFERFIQADIADVQARQGAGLGLSIAKAYVDMLGGRIWV